MGFDYSALLQVVKDIKYYFSAFRTTSRSWPDGLHENFISTVHPLLILKEISKLEESDSTRRIPFLVSWQEISKVEFDMALQCDVEEWT